MKQRGGYLFVLGLLAAAIMAGCAGSAPVISLESAWGRPSPSIAGAGAIFMVIKNASGAADHLKSVSSPACGTAELHETVAKADGTMGMNLVTEPLDVPANGQLELKSGGNHIMCMMMKADQFKTGNKIDVKLIFEKAGEKQVSVEIRDK